jgi:hypothetical protein
MDEAQSGCRKACTSHMLSLAKFGATCGFMYLADDSDDEGYDDDELE